MFHRQYMHAMLMESAVGEAGEGTPVKLTVNHKVSSWLPSSKAAQRKTFGRYMTDNRVEVRQYRYCIRPHNIRERPYGST